MAAQSPLMRRASSRLIALESEDSPIAARTLGLVIGRHIEGDCTKISTSPITANIRCASI